MNQDDKYVYTSLSDAYKSIYQPAQEPELKVEAADLAYVLGALIDDGTVTPDRIKEIMTEKMDPNRMKQYQTDGSKEIQRQMQMTRDAAASGKRTPAQKATTRAAAVDKRTPAQKMADSYKSPRTGFGGATRAD